LSSTINQGINSLAYFWSFPEIVAERMGFYTDEGISVVLHDVTPSGVVPSKSGMYKELQIKGVQDVYHAAEYVCIERAVGNATGKIVAHSPWSEEGLNGSFGLYVDPRGGIMRSEDLEGKPIAIEEGSGSYYTAIEDLTGHVSKGGMRLTQVGDPHLRIEALVHGEVAAASLMGPYADLAGEMGLVKLMDSRRRRGTLMIAKNTLDTSTLSGYLRATNRAIRSINHGPDEHIALYLEWFSKIIPKLGGESESAAKKATQAIVVPRWMEWRRYTKPNFDEVYRWMVERRLVEVDHTYEELVDSKAFRRKGLS
jgi:ABC-type nitrate/sulfonate/bicarbonate transport system substrate-binding protein